MDIVAVLTKALQEQQKINREYKQAFEEQQRLNRELLGRMIELGKKLKPANRTILGFAWMI